MARYGFHPEALIEYAAATTYYLREASPEVAERFVAAVESGIVALLAAPERWRVVEEPGMDSSLCYHPLPLRDLLPLGGRAATRHSLRAHALQSRAGILETANRLTAVTEPTC